MTEQAATAEAVERVDTPVADAAETTPTIETTTEQASAGAEATTATDTTAEAVDKAVTPTWPEDWREQLAGGDEAFLRQLKRYSSPTTFANGFKEREALIRSGKVKRDAPDPSDEKAMAEWRKEQGIPDKPDGYKLPDPVIKRLTDEDKPVLASFLEFAHSKGAPPQAVEIASEWYISQMEAAAEQRAQVDNEATQTAEDMLRKDWGPEYRGNITLAKRALESIPGVGASWAEFRGPDGRRLGDNPDFIMWAADIGRDQFGHNTFATGDGDARHTSRLAEIETIMKADIDRYYSEGLQKEHAELKAVELKRKR
jgi:hypothetical protein